MVKVSSCAVELEHGGACVRVFYQLYDFEPGALMVWMGTRSAALSNISCTLPQALPSATTLLGHDSAVTDRSDRLVRQLVARLRRPVYLSYNLPPSTPLVLLTRAEDSLFEIIAKTMPDQSVASSQSSMDQSTI